MFDDLMRDVEIDKLIYKYNVEIKNGTMIINKKIPMQDFIRLRESIRKIEKIDNIIVDADVESWRNKYGKN